MEIAPASEVEEIILKGTTSSRLKTGHERIIDKCIWQRYDSVEGAQRKPYHPLDQPNGNIYSDCLSVGLYIV